MKVIAMIPARLGSQRIPKKNLRYLGEKPLIMYPIELSKEANIFDEIWVNTESDILGGIAQDKGVGYHKRPDEFANNSATNREFTYEFLMQHDCDYVVMVNTTSPTLRVSTITKFVKFIEDHDYDVVMSVIGEKTESFYNGSPINFSKTEKINSQLIDPVERIVWALTAWKRDVFIENQDAGINPIFAGNLGLFSIPKDESADLDTEEDWKIAEGILTSRLEKNKCCRYYGG